MNETDKLIYSALKLVAMRRKKGIISRWKVKKIFTKGAMNTLFKSGYISYSEDGKDVLITDIGLKELRELERDYQNSFWGKLKLDIASKIVIAITSFLIGLILGILSK